MMKRRILQIVLIAAATGFLVAGVLSGGFSDVKNKASLICYECIGIG